MYLWLLASLIICLIYFDSLSKLITRWSLMKFVAIQTLARPIAAIFTDWLILMKFNLSFGNAISLIIISCIVGLIAEARFQGKLGNYRLQDPLFLLNLIRGSALGVIISSSVQIISLVK